MIPEKPAAHVHLNVSKSSTQVASFLHGSGRQLLTGSMVGVGVFGVDVGVGIGIGVVDAVAFVVVVDVGVAPPVVLTVVVEGAGVMGTVGAAVEGAVGGAVDEVTPPVCLVVVGGTVGIVVGARVAAPSGFTANRRPTIINKSICATTVQ